jgi:RNA polymerase sigma-70 factor (ECF subfamily)
VSEVEAALSSTSEARRWDPELSLQRSELAERVHAALDELPSPYGSVLEWKYIDGLSARDIATRLALSVKAAESLLTRARVAFRERFADRPHLVARSGERS